MILPQLDGKPGHTDAGAEITVSAEILDQLGTEDLEILSVSEIQATDVREIEAAEFISAFDI